jgi:hypothetical protein
LSQILLTWYSVYLTKEALERFGDFKVRGEGMCTVQCVDDLALLVKEETVVQGMIDRLIEIGNIMEWKRMWKN